MRKIETWAEKNCGDWGYPNLSAPIHGVPFAATIKMHLMESGMLHTRATMPGFLMSAASSLLWPGIILTLYFCTLGSVETLLLIWKRQRSF